MMPTTDAAARPYFVCVIGEMGTGKTSLLNLLSGYQGWLTDNAGLEGKLFYMHEEKLPSWWAEYSVAKRERRIDDVIYQTQLWFARQKLDMIRIAAGLDVQTGLPLDGSRSPGMYFIDRSLLEDVYVFAELVKDLFPDGRYDQYFSEVSGFLASLPRPDLVVRLRVDSPEVSKARVDKRGYGEDLPLEAYVKMAQQYSIVVDPWIGSLGVPVLEMRMDRPECDFNTECGQNALISEFFGGLRAYGFIDGREYPLPNVVLNGRH